MAYPSLHVSFVAYARQPETFPCESHLLKFVIRIFLFEAQFRLQELSINRVEYKIQNDLQRACNSSVRTFDIATCKLWYAISLLMSGKYYACLKTVNDVLSSIPEFALYYSLNYMHASKITKRKYVDMYSESNVNMLERGKTAWLMDLHFPRSFTRPLPLAILVEVLHCDMKMGVYVSPLTCAYHLIFLCYHELRQYDKRDLALRMLVEEVESDILRDIPCRTAYPALNITGHCLYLAGQKEHGPSNVPRFLP